MNKKQKLIIAAVLAVTALSASAVTTRWVFDASASDGNWTDAAKWDNGVPTASDTAVNFTAYTITLDSPGAVAGKFWNRNAGSASVLDIQAGGSLTVSGDVNLNEFSHNGGYQYAELLINGGELNANNLNIAARPTSQGEGTLIMNSGTVTVSNNFYIGKSSDGYEVHGEATLNNGTLDVGGNMHVGGAVNADGTGALNVHGGTLTSTNGFNYIGGWENLGAGTTNQGSGTVNVYGGSLTLGGSQIHISRSGSSDGTVNMYGGTFTALANINMDSDFDTGGKAEINLYGGEIHAQAGMDVANDSEIHFESGVLYWEGTNGVAAVSDWVANTNISWILGRTNMLTESWDASWTNTVTQEYGYWTNEITSILFADYNDVSAGDTTVWAYTPTPLAPPPVSDGAVNNHNFVNTSGDGLWTTPNNWNIGTAPTAEDKVFHNQNGDYLIVATDVEALQMFAQHADTGKVAVVEGGSLTLGEVFRVNSNSGQLIVDGGEVTTVDIGLGYDAGSDGRIELNSGLIEVSGSTKVGGLDATAAGTVTINGGTWLQPSDIFFVAASANDAGSGTLNVNGGLLQLYAGGTSLWQPLRIGDEGDGVVNLNGGTISLRNVKVGDATGLGSAELNLLGGTFEIDYDWQRDSDGESALSVQANGVVDIQGGTLQWRGDHTGWIPTNYVDTGKMVFSNGQTNMLTDAANVEVAITNGNDILFIDYDDVRTGYTTVWAYTTPAPQDPPVMLISAGAGSSVDVTASNLNIAAAYDLMGSGSLVFTNWVPVGSASGVAEATWNIQASDSVQFFQIQEQ